MAVAGAILVLFARRRRRGFRAALKNSSKNGTGDASIVPYALRPPGNDAQEDSKAAILSYLKGPAEPIVDPVSEPIANTVSEPPVSSGDNMRREVTALYTAIRRAGFSVSAVIDILANTRAQAGTSEGLPEYEH